MGWFRRACWDGELCWDADWNFGGGGRDADHTLQGVEGEGWMNIDVFLKILGTCIEGGRAEPPNPLGNDRDQTEAPQATIDQYNWVEGFPLEQKQYSVQRR